MSEAVLGGAGTMSKQVAGQYLISLRQIANLNQDAVAQRAGLSERQLSRLENGKSMPTLIMARKLMDALDGSIETFLDLLISKKATTADAMRAAANGHSMADLARKIKTEDDLNKVIREFRARSGA